MAVEYASNGEPVTNGHASNSGATSDGDDRSRACVLNQQALVLAQSVGGDLYAHTLGNEVLEITIGSHRTKNAAKFVIHRKRLESVGLLEDFDQLLREEQSPHAPNQIHFEDATSDMFILLEDYVYTGKLAVVNSAMSTEVQVTRLVELCKLYVFAEKNDLPNDFMNRIMDAIQDGFALTDKLPAFGLVSNVYKKSVGDSKLRLFLIHAILFGQRAQYPLYKNIAAPIMDNPEICKSYIEAMQMITFDESDPRIRDCRNESGCVECEKGMPRKHHGYWPCSFHVHGPKSNRGNGSIQQDSGCYLWADPNLIP